MTATLRAESRELFDQLEAAQEVQRLRRLDHLGAVRLAYDGAHHSRWEYVVTVLALIDRAASIPRTQLHSEVRNNGRPIASSGAELLKSWALLLNVGHLGWTFSSERVLLQELWASRLRRRSFLAGLPREFRDAAARVIRDGDYYSLYQFIAAYRLERMSSEHSRTLPWRPILSSYVLEPRSQQVERERRMFRRLRRVGYLGLDTEYAPGAVTLDLGKVLADDRTLERHALAFRDADEAELVALDAHMARTVYLARKVLTAMACREERLRRAIRSTSATDVERLIHDLAWSGHQQDSPAADLTAAVRVHFRALPPLDAFMTPGTNPRVEEDYVRRELQLRRVVAIPVVWSVPDRGEWVIQIHTERTDTVATARSIAALTSRLFQQRLALMRRLEFLTERDIQSFLLSPIAKDLIGAALACAFGDAVRWEWSITLGPDAILSTRKEARELVAREARAWKSRPGGEARRAELDLLHTMLLGRPSSPVVVSVASLRAFRGDERVPFAEVDALYIEERGGHLVVALGEAKTGQGSINAATRELGAKLARLPVTSPAVVSGPLPVTRPLRALQAPVRSRAVATLSL